jgi:hypothetical protein
LEQPSPRRTGLGADPPHFTNETISIENSINGMADNGNSPNFPEFIHHGDCVTRTATHSSVVSVVLVNEFVSFFHSNGFQN